MLNVLQITSPFFLLVFLGWIFVKIRLIDSHAVSSLSTFVLYAALPCMLLQFTANISIHQIFNFGVIGVYLLVAVGMVAASFFFLRSRQTSRNDASFGALVASFPNTGFMGVAMITTFLGSEAAAPVIVVMLVDMVLTSTLCIALSQGFKGGAGYASALKALKGTLSNPLPWAIAIGIGISAWEIHPPEAIASTIQLLASAGTPVALFAIGAALGAIRAADLNSKGSQVLTTVAGLTFIKLCLHPIMIFLVGTLALRMWGGPSQAQVVAISLAAALPSAGNAMMLASRYGADPRVIALIVLATTTLAIASFSTFAWLLT